MTNTIKISKEEAKGLYCGDNNRFFYVDTIEGDRLRWATYMMVIFKDAQENHYAFNYERGHTEYQDNTYPWDDSNTVECYRVEPVEVKTIEYRKVL